MIVTRNVDLSVGSVLGLSAYFAGDLLSGNQGMPLPLVFALGIALGAACGLLNGILVTWGQVPALVVTLGTLYMFRGLAFLWTDGRQVNAETLPDSFLNLGSDSIAGVPILVLFALVGARRHRPVAARLPRRTRALRDRLEPRGRAAGGRALRSAAC